MQSMQSRLKSKVTWVTVTSALLLLLGNLGIFEKIGIEESAIKGVIDFVLFGLVSFGILNNPTDPENF